MRAIHLTAFGNPVESLEFVQIQEPAAPGPGHQGEGRQQTMIETAPYVSAGIDADGRHDQATDQVAFRGEAHRGNVVLIVGSNGRYRRYPRPTVDRAAQRLPWFAAGGNRLRGGGRLRTFWPGTGIGLDRGS